MSQSSTSPQRPNSTASFGMWLDYYTHRVHLSQNHLAIAAGMNQSTLNKIANGQIQDVTIDTLFCLSLALQLTDKEAIDLMARHERAFSPANPKHKLYLKLIRRNNKQTPSYNLSSFALAEIFDEVDELLVKHGYNPISKQR